MSSYRTKTFTKTAPVIKFETCRICKKTDRSVVNGVKDYAPFIQKIAQVDINLSPEFPQFLCNLCVERLLDAVMMCDMCQESEAALQNLMEPEENEEPEVEFKYKQEYDEETLSIASEVRIKEEEMPEEIIEPTTMEYEAIETEQCVEEPGVEHDEEETGHHVGEPTETLEDSYMEEERLEEELIYVEEEAIEVEEVEENSDDNKNNIEIRFLRSRSPSKNKGETSYQRKLRKLKEKRAENRKLGIQPPKRFYGCCQCPFRAEKISQVEKHFTERHPSARPEEKSNNLHNCQLCWAGFESREEKIQHMQLPRKKNYECSECSLTFEVSELYRQHLRDFHNNPKEFKCEHCPKIYNNINSLRGHNETVHKGVRHVCDECGAIYRRADTLREHQNLHRQEKPFGCPHCDARFARKTGLSSHLRSHTGARPYACEYCDRTFAFATDKKRHLPVHTGIYPYTCHICNKGFTRKNILNQHIETHDE